jgi:hypothetical protein
MDASRHPRPCLASVHVNDGNYVVGVDQCVPFEANI